MNKHLPKKVFKKSSFDAFFTDADDAQFILDSNNLFIDWNQKALDLFGFNKDNTFNDIHPSQISPEYQPSGILSQIQADKHISDGYANGVTCFPWVHKDINHRLLGCEVTLKDISRDDKKLQHATVRFLDLLTSENMENWILTNLSSNSYVSNKSDQYLLLNEYKKAIDSSSIVSKMTLDGTITYVNDYFCTISGYKRSELLGQNHDLVSHPDMPKFVFKDLWDTILAGNIWQGILINQKKNGDTYYVDTTVTPILDPHGTIKEFILIRTDITKLYEQEKLIAFQHTDPITKLPNLTKLEYDLKADSSYNLLILDIKELKDIQIYYHSDVYKRLVVAISQTIKAFVRHLTVDASIYCISKREFALTFPEAMDIENLKSMAEMLIHYIDNNTKKNEDFYFQLTTNVGISFGASQPSQKIQQARMAVITCLSIEENTLVYSDENNPASLEIQTVIEWTSKIKHALQHKNLCVFGQHIYDKNNQIIYTETLMRLYNEDKSDFLKPYDFLPYAKKSMMYHHLSNMMIETVMEHFASLKDQHFSLNLSMLDILSDSTSKLLREFLRKSDIGKRMTIELIETEEVDFTNPKLLGFIRELKSYGVTIALDDFGSGYSNFISLVELPIDIVKIDGSLIRDIFIHDKKRELVKSIIYICDNLNLKTVAEFVEDREHFVILKEMGIDYFQGYHLHKPELICD